MSYHILLILGQICSSVTRKSFYDSQCRYHYFLITKPWLHAEVFDYVENCMYLCNFDSGLCPLEEKRDGRSYAVMRWWTLRRQTVIFSCK